MGILFNIIYKEYERQVDLIFATQSTDTITVYMLKKALDNVLNRIQWNGCTCYGYIFNRDLAEAFVNRIFTERFIGFRDIMNKFEARLQPDEVLIVVEKLLSRPLSEDEILKYTLQLQIDRLDLKEV